MNDDTSLVNRLRHASTSPEAARAAADDELRRATQQLLNAGFPLDVHHRYADVKSRNLSALNGTAEKVHQVLTGLDAGDHVLSGKVAEGVRKGIAQLASHTGYTGGVESIR